jgi:phenylacetate-CoA ligase
MFWFGSSLSEQVKPWENKEAWDQVLTLRQEFASIPVSDIISILDSFSALWLPGTEFYLEALGQLKNSSSFTIEEVEQTLSILPKLLSKESLEKRLSAEFFPLDVLDKFSKSPRFSGKVRALPLGLVLHVTAGNVFLSSIDSLIMGLLTKNINLIKVSSDNTFFPKFFAQKLADFDSKKIISNKFSILHWRGGEEKIEDIFKSKVDAIIAWGGEEMIDSYSKNLPTKVKFISFGPKISIQVISAVGLVDKDLSVVAEKIVKDIVPWDQSACASPQNLYLQEDIQAEEFIRALDAAFKMAPQSGKLTSDEAVEILKERYRSIYSELMQGGKSVAGENYLLHLEDNKYLRPSPLHRSLIIKRFKNQNDLFLKLEPFSYYLQSCSYLLGSSEKDSYLESLAMSGVKRFAPLGTITQGMEGAPHDGKYVLRELTHFVVDEFRVVDFGSTNDVLTDSQELKKKFEQTQHPRGYIFSSGGTTGEPKFVHFSYEEFDFITDMLAFNLKCQGVKPGMIVANLFVAGNLWSSFMAMEKALEKIGAIQLPIGGLCSQDNILMYLKKFKPDVVMGIPSMLIMNAEFSVKHGADLNVPLIFYAGEALSEARKEFFRNHWKTSYFGSAGYASVDAGVIAYQCSNCGPGEHHIFTDLVEMKIVDEEAVVTPYYRTSLPIINYRTGDRVEWVLDHNCKTSDKKFRLLGRKDNLILIWSCRLRLEDIELSLSQTAPQIKTFQILLLENKGSTNNSEILKFQVEGGPLENDLLAQNIYLNSRDLKDTLSFEEFASKFVVECLAPGEIFRNERTGKISIIKDLRIPLR